MRCRECGGEMKDGVAIQNIWTSGGRKGAKAARGECIVPSRGDWIMVTCHKCEDCGHTVSHRGQLTLAA